MAPRRQAAEQSTAGGTAATDNRDVNTEDLHAQVRSLQEQLGLLRVSMERQQSNSPGPGIPTPQESIIAAPSFRFPAIQIVSPILEGKSTWSPWNTKIEAIAQSLDLWGIISTGATAPMQHMQYARSLIVLNVSESIQIEIRHMSLAYEIWKHLTERYGVSEFSDLMFSVRGLRRLRFTGSYESDDKNIESFYRKFKDTQTAIQEVAGKPLPDLVLVAVLLDAVEGNYSDFATLMESHLNHPSTAASQKTFEYVFARFRSEVYRAKATHISSTELPVGYIGGIQGVKEEKQKCGYCGRWHGPDCWTLYPEKAPANLREHYVKRHEQMEKPKQLG